MTLTKTHKQILFTVWLKKDDAETDGKYVCQDFCNAVIQQERKQWDFRAPTDKITKKQMETYYFKQCEEDAWQEDNDFFDMCKNEGVRADLSQYRRHRAHGGTDFWPIA